MFFVTNLCLCVFSIVILAAISLTSRRTVENDSLGGKIYVSFLFTTMALLIADLFSRFDGRTEQVFLLLNQTGNFLLFFLNPMLPVMWLIYVHNVVFCDDRKTVRFARPFVVLAVINAGLTIISQFNGWYYTIDTQNIYHRGILFFIPSIVDLTIMGATFVLLIAKRKRIEKQYFKALLFFGILPTACIVLQYLIYGIAFALNGITISLVIMFINTQNRRMNIDYLTGVFNRKQLDYYIEDKIRGCSGSKSFSAILMDLDNFKFINDSLGHQVGDEALKTVVTLLKKCTRRSDFIARYGGDEFYIVMDMSDHHIILEVVERIKKSISDYNDKGISPYKLSLSMGYLIYDVRQNMNVEEFQAQVDKMMYLDKTANRIHFEQLAFEL